MPWINGRGIDGLEDLLPKFEDITDSIKQSIESKKPLVPVSVEVKGDAWINFSRQIAKKSCYSKIFKAVIVMYNGHPIAVINSK